VAASFSLTGSLRLDPRWTDDLNTTTVTDSARVNITFALANGDDDGEADAYWKDVRTVAASTTDTIDLSELPLSLFGGSEPLDMATVRMIYVRNLSTTIELTYAIAGGSDAGIPPGGSFMWFAPEATADVWLAGSQLIEIANDGASAANYEIILIGVKAA
jgi:hypothetical protein